MYKAIRPHKPRVQEDRAWHVVFCLLHNARCLRTCLLFTDLVNIKIMLISTDFKTQRRVVTKRIYRVSQEEWTKLWESVPYV